MSFRTWIIDKLAGLPGVSGYSFYGVLCHPIEALLLYPARSVKFFWQRGRRGYSDCDVWNLGWYLNSWLPEAIREVVKDKPGTPISVACDLFGPDTDWSNLSEEQWDTAHAEWLKIAEAMAAGFEAARTMEEELPMPDTERYKQLAETHQKGMALFAKYYQGLWN